MDRRPLQPLGPGRSRRNYEAEIPNPTRYDYMHQAKQTKSRHLQDYNTAMDEYRYGLTHGYPPQDLKTLWLVVQNAHKQFQVSNEHYFSLVKDCDPIESRMVVVQANEIIHNYLDLQRSHRRTMEMINELETAEVCSGASSAETLVMERDYHLQPPPELQPSNPWRKSVSYEESVFALDGHPRYMSRQQQEDYARNYQTPNTNPTSQAESHVSPTHHIPNHPEYMASTPVSVSRGQTGATASIGVSEIPKMYSNGMPVQVSPTYRSTCEISIGKYSKSNVSTNPRQLRYSDGKERSPSSSDMDLTLTSPSDDIHVDHLEYLRKYSMESPRTVHPLTSDQHSLEYPRMPWKSEYENTDEIQYTQKTDYRNVRFSDPLESRHIPSRPSHVRCLADDPVFTSADLPLYPPGGEEEYHMTPQQGSAYQMSENGSVKCTHCDNYNLRNQPRCGWCTEPLTSDSKSPQPNTPLESSYQMDGLREIIREMKDSNQALLDAQRTPAPKLMRFGGDASQWERFRTSFLLNVDAKKLQPEDKLQQLFLLLDGRAAVTVAPYLEDSDADQAYLDAKNELERKFGHPARISAAAVNKLKNCKSIGNNDTSALEEYAANLKSLKLSYKRMNKESALDNILQSNKLWEKLPAYMIRDWKSSIIKRQKTDVNYDGSFDDFYQLIEDNVAKACLPGYEKSEKSEVNERRGTGRAHGRQAHVTEQVITSQTSQVNKPVQASSDKPPQANPAKPMQVQSNQNERRYPREEKKKSYPWCPACKADGETVVDHLLPQCPRFKKLKPSQRFKLVLDSNYCVNCISYSNHTDANCKTAPQKSCARLDCRESHHTMIHEPHMDHLEKLRKNKNPQSRMETQPDPRVTQPDTHHNATIPIRALKSSEPIPDVYHTTGMTLVDVRVLGQKTWHEAMSHCDNGANCCHVADTLQEKLEIPDNPREGILETAAGTITESYTPAVLEIKQHGVPEDKAFIERIPVRCIKDYPACEVVHVETKKYPKLRGLNFGPRHAGTKTEITLGTNCYSATSVVKTVPLGPGKPIAHLTGLGWILLGATGIPMNRE